MTAVKVPPSAPAPGLPERTMSSVAADGVAFLVHWLITLLLLGQAATSVLRPPAGVVAIGIVSGLICLLWATFNLGMGILRGTLPDGSDRPPPGWLGVITTAGCLISLAILRAGTGGTGPWPAELLTAGLLAASVTVWAGPLAGGISAIALGVLVLVVPLGGRGVTDGDQLLRTSLATAVPAIALVAAGFSIALALVALGRAARGLQRNLDVRYEVKVREQAVGEAAQVAAEVERSLHDTALNTLETISAHGDHLDPDVVAARCRSDHDQLSLWRRQADLSDLSDVVDRLESHAHRLGLALDSALVSDPADGREPGAERRCVPGPVLSALARAGTEALTNVVKHAGVSEATLLVHHDPGGVQVFIADEGVGARDAPHGFGVARSIRERMESVGGEALTGPGPQGHGTVVLLEWHRKPQAGPELGSDLLAGTARVVLMVGTFLAGTAGAMVVLGWPAYSRPWLALIGAVAPVIVAAGALERARNGRPVGPSQVVAACATYVLVGAVALLADPYCASLLGEGVMLDARAPMMAVILLLAPRQAVLAAIVVTVGAAHLGAALAWSDRWVLCGPDTAEAGVYVVAVLGASWLFVERIDRLTTELADAREEALAAQIRIGAQLTLRAEEEAWVADTLASAQGLLDDIAQGRRDPRAHATRVACGSEAEFLRALLVVGRAPLVLRRPARIWLRLLHAHACRIQLRGSFEDLEVPAGTVGEIGGVIDMLCTQAPGASVTLSAWSDPTPSIMLSAAGPPVVGAGGALTSRFDRFAGSAWRDVDPEGIRLEWAWPHQVPQPATPAR